jgi:hypothetical protein
MGNGPIMPDELVRELIRERERRLEARRAARCLPNEFTKPFRRLRRGAGLRLMAVGERLAGQVTVGTTLRARSDAPPTRVGQ